MKAEIIAIGTEILIGDTLNTNSQFISKKLKELGISVYYHSTVGDNKKRLYDILKNSLNRSDIVITTGGLGPTDDDITVEIAANIFDKKVVTHDESLKKAIDFFKKRGIQNTENALSQSQVISDSKVLINENGLAPGSIVEKNDKILIILPGPPEELKNMWKNVHLYLQSKSDGVILSKIIHMAGIGESSAENILKDLINAQENPTIAPYAKSIGGVSFRITAKAKTENEANNLIEPMKKEVYKKLGKYIFAEDDSTLENEIIKLLKENNLTISIAESITGGKVVSRLIDVAGASEVLKEGIVAYSNEAKLRHNLTNYKNLEKYTAVSEQVSKDMAKNIAISSGSNIGISTTGYAQKEKNEGMSFLSIYFKYETHTFNFNTVGNRERVRNQATTAILWHLYSIIKNNIN
ncbi:MAG: competence/damage-inducible protein A [Defluviitaleaceae bacterium]|nr:competence/damage-inducible protein A [Defluviitaleaceae bacterium]